MILLECEGSSIFYYYYDIFHGQRGSWRHFYSYWKRSNEIKMPSKHAIEMKFKFVLRWAVASGCFGSRLKSNDKSNGYLQKLTKKNCLFILPETEK